MKKPSLILLYSMLISYSFVSAQVRIDNQLRSVSSNYSNLIGQQQKTYDYINFKMNRFAKGRSDSVLQVMHKAYTAQRKRQSSALEPTVSYVNETFKVHTMLGIDAFYADKYQYFLNKLHINDSIVDIGMWAEIKSLQKNYYDDLQSLQQRKLLIDGLLNNKKQFRKFTKLASPKITNTNIEDLVSEYFKGRY